jgi:eukaryotic-like serine/threonine-protein kinase
MALSSGTKLGPYEIQSPLGAGGMGEVYRARDTRLERTVAIKILPTHLSDSTEFKQRFEREARAISSLNHSHICHLYDIGSHDGTDFLVMEFLDGETLADRLRKGAMPLPELLKIGMQISEALETAHKAGIVHRDLKPANIMLTKSGAKLMDFGLAKPTLAAAGAAPLLSAAVTMTAASPISPLTTAGSVVGTIQYMSPEQIEGKDADPRSDIFAFGAVLYEMATGKRAFEGKNQISVASAILEKDPEAISKVMPLSPAALDYLVATCMAKDRDERFQTAHDLRLQLKGILLTQSAAIAASQAQTSRSRTRGLWLAGLALLLAGAIIAYVLKPGNPPASPVRAYIPPPPGTSFPLSGLEIGPVVVSPDGKTLAFTAVDEQGVTKLWLRGLNAQEATPLDGTEDASKPFWSFDGQALAFAADGRLKKVGVAGGTPQVLADGLASESGGGTWNANATILFCKDRSGPIYRVNAQGGELSLATKLRGNELSHAEPYFLPDGKHFLYTVLRSDGPSEIAVGELDKQERDGTAVVSATMPEFASDRLLFSRDGHIMAQSFDTHTWKVSGDPQTLGNARFFSVSTNGMLAYNESSAESELKVFDRNGNVVATPGPHALYGWPRFSPDGKSIALTVADPKSRTEDVWIYPVTGGPPARITFGPQDISPTWSPDGKELAYVQFDVSPDKDGGDWSIRRRALDGSHPEETIYKNAADEFGLPIDWSHDGKFLSMHLSTKDEVFSNWGLPLNGGPAFRPAATAGLTASEYEGKFSPDGRWLTFFSYETGRPEVYVVPFPGTGPKTQVSTTGGWLPRFGGRELFYVTMGNKLMAAQIHTQPTFGVDSIRPMFQLDFPNLPHRTLPLYDVSADGQHFAVLTGDRSKTTTITLLTNWPAELKK